MSSVNEILELVQTAQEVNTAYLTLQGPLAERLSELAGRQAALVQLVGEHVADLAGLLQDVDMRLEQQQGATSRISDASLNLEVAAIGTESGDLRHAVSAVSSVASNAEEFGGRLVRMSTTLAGQQGRMQELQHEMQDVAGETGAMAQHAREHTDMVAGAQESLTLYVVSVSS